MKLKLIKIFTGDKMAKDLIDIILAVVQIFTLIALVLYVKKTWDMADSTEKSVNEMKETRDQESAPYVLVYFDFHGHEMYLIVENVGKGLAKDVSFDFEPSLVNSRGNKISELSLLKDGIGSIPPNYKIRHFFDMSFNYFENNLPLKYRVKTSYYGGLKYEKRTTEHILDAGFYQMVSFLDKKGLNELAKTVDNLNENNKKIANNLDEIRKILDSGISIKNNKILITNLEMETNLWFNVTESTLLQFKHLWNSIYGKQRELINPFISDLKNNAKFLSSEILIIASKHPNTVSDEILDNLIKISSELLSLSEHKFYLDGGLSVKKFDSSGDEIIKLIDETIQKIKDLEDNLSE